MNSNLAVPGGSLKSKPMWRNTFGLSVTSVFSCALGTAVGFGGTIGFHIRSLKVAIGGALILLIGDRPMAPRVMAQGVRRDIGNTVSGGLTAGNAPKGKDESCQ